MPQRAGKAGARVDLSLGWLISSAWRGSSGLVGQRRQRPPMGRPGPTKPASWRVQTVNAVVENTRRVEAAALHLAMLLHDVDLGGVSPDPRSCAVRRAGCRLPASRWSGGRRQ